MKRHRRGLEDHLEAVQPHPPGEVHVIAVEKEILGVETVELPEQHARNHRAGRGRPPRLPLLRVVILRVLDRQLLCLHHAHPGRVELRQHGFNQAGGYDDVRILDQENIGAVRLRQFVVTFRRAEVSAEEGIVDMHRTVALAEGLKLLRVEARVKRAVPVADRHRRTDLGSELRRAREGGH